MKYDAEHIKAQIVKWLLKGNLSFNHSKDSIGLEVLFSANKRKADVLILSKYLHALEIKGDFDNLKKLKGQLKDYHKTFDKVSLVTTPKHLQKIYKIINPSTGLILFNDKKLKIIRNAKKQKRLNKRDLLMFLSKNELTNLIKITKHKNLSTDQVRKIASQRLNTKKIRQVAYSSLKKCYGELFRFFLNDTGGKNIIYDELRGLCGKVNKLKA
jgi:hypothetical protein